MKDILKTTVTLDGRTVGVIRMTPERNRCVFEYDRDWIADGSDWMVKFRHSYDPSDIGKTEFL